MEQHALAISAMHDGDALLLAAHLRGQLLHHAVQLVVVLVGHAGAAAAAVEAHPMVQDVAQRVAEPREINAGAPGADASACLACIWVHFSTVMYKCICSCRPGRAQLLTHL